MKPLEFENSDEKEEDLVSDILTYLMTTVFEEKPLALAGSANKVWSPARTRFLLPD